MAVSYSMGVQGARRFLTLVLKPGKSLTDRVLRAGFWSFTIRSGLRLVGFVRNIILARLLAPDDFGLFGIALVMLSGSVPQLP